MGDNDDALFQAVPLLSKPPAEILPLPPPLCNEVDIPDGTWTDVDGWMLRLVPVAPIFVPAVRLCNWELFNDVDIKFDAGVTFDKLIGCWWADWLSEWWTDNCWHGDFGEWTLFTKDAEAVAMDADVDEGGPLAADADDGGVAIGKFNAMEDECNEFTFDVYLIKKESRKKFN